MTDDPRLLEEAAPVQVLAMGDGTATALQRLGASLGLDAVRIDLAGCRDKAGLLERVATALGFPEWFGGNWDAFYDCLADLGWREASGWLLVLENTGDLRRHAPEALDTAVAILGDAAEAWASRGRVFRAVVAA
jgi:RNAse (barnase) inhibitor barstar